MPGEDNNPPNDPPELVLDEVVEVAPDKLDEDQTKFIREKADDLTDEQKETFKDVLEEEEGKPPEEIEVRTRTPKKKKKETTPEPEDDDDVDPEDEEAIGKVVKKEIKPLQDQLDAQTKRSQKLADEGEVDAFIRDNPEFSKYRANALKYMKAHPSLVASDAIGIVSSQDQQKIGAKKEREATQKAEESRSPGSSARKPKAGEIDWSKASRKEVAAKKQEILDQSRE